jgi:hypothetical protein
MELTRMNAADAPDVGACPRPSGEQKQRAQEKNLCFGYGATQAC